MVHLLSLEPPSAVPLTAGGDSKAVSAHSPLLMFHVLTGLVSTVSSWPVRTCTASQHSAGPKTKSQNLTALAEKALAGSHRFGEEGVRPSVV